MPGIDALHLLEEAVRPALRSMGKDYATKQAEQLVMGTAAVESRFIWLRQHGNGPARGLWQMEPDTFEDLIARCPDKLWLALCKMAVHPDKFDEVTYNLRFAAAMCRIKYLDDPNPIPDPGDIPAMERTHKIHYNSIKGKTKPGEFARAWEDLIAPRYKEMWPSA